MLSEERDSIERAIRQFLVDRAWLESSDALEDGDSLLSKGVIDSVVMTELITFIEKTYELKIDDEELMPDNFDSLSSIGSFIRTKRRDLA